jgi:hypothetical protein
MTTLLHQVFLARPDTFCAEKGHGIRDAAAIYGVAAVCVGLS